MSDPSTIAIVASNLLGKTVERVENGFTITTVINSYEVAVTEALKLFRMTTPSIR